MARTRKRNATKIQLLKHDFEQISTRWDQPPRNYSFVPKGDVYITRHWIHTKKRLSVHYHSLILDAIKVDAAATAERRQKVVCAVDSKAYARNREQLFEHFSDVPADSATDILDHSFLKGSGRVGRVQTLDARLRISLAVNAHIRHKLTNYDSILSETAASKQDVDAKQIARETVYDQVQAIADSWRTKSKVRLTKNETPEQSTRLSAAPNSATILEKNRARRKVGNHSKASTTANSGALALEEALAGLQIDEGSDIKLSRAQRRRTAIEGDLEQLKLHPDHPLTDKRLIQALTYFRKNGGEGTSLGGMVEARAAEVRIRHHARRKETRRTKRANNAANRETGAVLPVQPSPSAQGDTDGLASQSVVEEAAIQLEEDLDGHSMNKEPSMWRK